MGPSPAVTVLMAALGIPAVPVPRFLVVFYASGVRRRPVLAASLPWTRVASMLILGGLVRERLAKSRRHASSLVHVGPRRPLL